MSKTENTGRKLKENNNPENNSKSRFSNRLSNLWFWEVDLKTGELYSSIEREKLLGYEDGKIRNITSWKRLIHPEDLPGFSNKYSAFKKHPVGVLELEYRVRHQDGSYRWLYSQAEIILDTSGNNVCMHGCHIDISQQKQSEFNLLPHQPVFEAFNSLNSNIAVLDSCGVITFVNDSWRMFDISTNGNEHAKCRIGNNFLSICRERAKAKPDGYFEQTLIGLSSILNGELSSFTIDYPCDSHQPMRWFRTDVVALAGGIKGALVVYTDITEQKQTQEQLAEISKVQQLILENAPVAIMKVIDRKICWSNNKTVDLLLYTKDELIKQPTRMLFETDEDYDQLCCFYSPHFQEGETAETEVHLIRKDGRRIDVRIMRHEDTRHQCANRRQG